MFITLYKTLVRPMIEYGNSVWGPYYYILNQQNIEIQRRAMRSLSGLQDISYPDRLQTLCLPSLKFRRLRGDMILVYRLINNNFGIDFNDLFTTPTLTSTSRPIWCG